MEFVRYLPVIALLWCTAPVLAQSTNRPLVTPPASVADTVGASALVNNPAAFVPPGTFEFLHSDGPSSLPVGGEALYLVAGAGLGLSVEWARSPGNINHLLFTAGHRLPVSRTFSLGFNYGFAPRGASDFRYDTISAGALWRPSRFWAVGIAGHHLNNPRGKGPGGASLRFEPRLETGIAIRPLGKPNLTLTADMQKVDGQLETWRFGLRGEPVRGLQLYVASDTEGHFTTGITVRQVHTNYRGHAVTPTGSTRPGWVFGIDSSIRRQDTVLRGGTTLAKVTVEGDYPDQKAGGLFGGSGNTLPRLLRDLERIQGDPTVDGIVVELRSFEGGLAKAREVRAAFMRVRDSGKPVYCHANTFSTTLYLVATGCETIAMSPGGTVFLTGLAATYQFLGGPLEKVGVDVQFVRRGKFKGSPETIAFQEPTEPFAEQMNALLDSSFETLVASVATGRGLETASVTKLIEQGAFIPSEAKEAGLIDDVMHSDEMQDFIKGRSKSKPNVVKRYRRVAHRSGEWGNPPAVAVVYVTGAIVDGGSRNTPLGGASLAGADTLKAALKAARKNDRVKAVVLRVDSPGGSSLASDVIWREVVRLVEKKPVVVSMGDVAASGGYYVAAPATEIFADDATVTGSIGVYMLRPNFTELYKKINLNHVTYKRGEHSNLFSGNEPLTEIQTATLEKLVEAFYQDFLQHVADGRDKTKEEVHEIAQGRVWTGRQAKQVGLVDKLGGLHAAIARARELAEIPSERTMGIIELPRSRNVLETLMAGTPEAAPLANVIPAVGTLETWAAMGQQPSAFSPFRFVFIQ